MDDVTAAQTKRLPMAPHAVAALILSIGGCVNGWSYGVPGIIMGAIGKNLAQKAQIAMQQNPNGYRGHRIIEAAFRWGKTSVTQGIIIAIVSTIFWILYFGFIIALVTSSID